MRHTLESQKAFPFIAWAVVLMFTGFVYVFATGSTSELSQLSERTATLENNVQANLEAVYLSE